MAQNENEQNSAATPAPAVPLGTAPEVPRTLARKLGLRAVRRSAGLPSPDTTPSAAPAVEAADQALPDATTTQTSAQPDTANVSNQDGLTPPLPETEDPETDAAVDAIVSAEGDELLQI